MPFRNVTLLYEVTSLVRTFDKLQYVLMYEPYYMNVVGIRAKNGVENSFDDAVGVLYKDFGNAWNLKLWQATTDPGQYYLKNPMNVAGTAILMPGQYKNSHKLGKHKGQYEALVQTGTLKIWRDRNKNTALDFTDPQVAEQTGINIHRASATSRSQQVDKWSAGCQVFADGFDYELFMWHMNEHTSRQYGLFTYTLFDQSQLI